MSEQNLSAFNDQDEPASGGSPKLPGGISVQAAAIILLIVVLLAILWLFFGPTSDSDTPAGLSTPTTAPDASGSATAQAALPLGTVVTPAAPADGSPAVATSPLIVNATPGTAIIGAATAIGGGTPGAGAATTAQGTPGAAATTAPLAVDTFVAVANTDDLGMRLRFGAGLDTASIRSVVEEGEVLRVVGGPESADGITWWRLQDMYGNIGWAAQEYLTPTAAPSTWSPPAASPTFEAQPSE